MRTERGVNHQPPSSAEVKKKVELYLHPPSGPSWPVIQRNLPMRLLSTETAIADLLPFKFSSLNVGLKCVLRWNFELSHLELRVRPNKPGGR